MFIRYWAQTDASAAAVIALDYCQALLRFAPVRLISLTGQLEGRWAVMSRLLETNMITPMVNVVCAEQEHWARTIEVGMPESDTMRATIATGKAVETKVERVKHERELYTVGVRNVLIATKLPTLQRYARAAEKYEAIVAPTPDLADRWNAHSVGLVGSTYSRVALPYCVPLPIAQFQTLRTAVFGSN